MRRILILLFFVLNFSGFTQTVDTIPYLNNFDTPQDTIGWSHYAISGTDDWEWGIPSYNNFFYAYSWPNAWATNLTGDCSGYSERVLQSPYFDISNTIEDYALSFWQKRELVGLTELKLEYRLNSDTTWLLLDHPDALKKNWQGVNGFTGNVFYLGFKHSAIDLDFLQGNDSVQFRFKCFTDYSTDYGWMIDNFNIDEPLFNISAEIGDTIKGVNKYFSEIEVISEYSFDNQWGEYFNITSNFYLSTDSILDNTDSLMNSIDHWILEDEDEWENTLDLPEDLHAGYYYIIYEMDIQDSLIESDENDNISFSILQVDSILETPYVEDFESSENLWNDGVFSENNHWKKGDAKKHYAERPHSGNNLWYVEPDLNTEGYNYLESPYIDLSNSTNSTICFWYRNGEEFFFRLMLPDESSILSSFPTFPATNTTPGDSYNINIPFGRRYDYDCYCKDISNYDGKESFKFLMRSHVNADWLDTTYTEVVLDDFYVGEAKADISLEGEKNFRYTSTDLVNDTLEYLVYNSGLNSLPQTNTKFYWSEDTVLDNSDIYLGSNTEEAMTDTSYIYNEFVYTKPDTSTGIYYIFYQLDTAEVVQEMREYNNSGYFKINQIKRMSLPYEMDFETQPVSWHHESSWGTDEWMWSEPQGTDLNTAFSGTKAIITMDTGLISYRSRMHYSTPVFDLTELQNPALEFDMLSFEVVKGFINSWGIYGGKINLLYSTDGGAKWKELVASNSSFRKMNTGIEYIASHGKDLQHDHHYAARHLYTAHISKALLGNSYYYPSYQGRNYDDNYHYAIDLEAIKNEKKVQFMFVYGNLEAPTEGAMIDNFKIKEAQSDLILANRKNMMVRSSDTKIRQNIWIKNDGNYSSDSTFVKIYASSDSLLGPSDNYLTSKGIPYLKPYEKHQINLAIVSPSNYQNYNYLLFEIDPNDSVQEINETNNIDYMKLNMDTAQLFSYPMLFDFEDTIMDGWVWYHDFSGSIHGHRFRHIAIENDRVYKAQSGEWFLDLIHHWGNTYDPYPHFYIESPSFDFTYLPNPKLEFDLICVGGQFVDSQGGSIEYSTDSGDTWQALGSVQDPLGTNWFETSINSLNGSPGWYSFHDWHEVSYLADILGGESDVKFRFHFRSSQYPSSSSYHGLRMDNFNVSGSVIPHTFLNDIEICENDSIELFGIFQSNAGTYYDTLVSSLGNDSILIQELNVLALPNESQNLSACLEYFWPLDNQMYNSSGTYTTTISNSVGCDSIITLNLIINEVNTEVSINGSTLISDADTATYQWINCDMQNAILNGETNSSYTPILNGNYAVIVGQNGCVDTSSCYSITNVGLIEIASENIFEIFPNPTSGIFNLKFDNSYDINIKIYNVLGEVVYQRDNIMDSEIQLYLNQPNGIYFVEVTSREFKKKFKLLLK